MLEKIITGLTGLWLVGNPLWWYYESRRYRRRGY